MLPVEEAGPAGRRFNCHTSIRRRSPVVKPLTNSFPPRMGWTGRGRALKLSEMKTEDLLAYERERKNVCRAFAQAAIELVLPLAAGRARPATAWAEAKVSSSVAPASVSSGNDPHLGE